MEQVGAEAAVQPTDSDPPEEIDGLAVVARSGVGLLVHFHVVGGVSDENGGNLGAGGHKQGLMQSLRSKENEMNIQISVETART